MKDEAARVSSLIGDVYDAALDPALWPDVLQKLGAFVGGPAAAVYFKDTVRRTGNVFYSFGVEPHFVQSYFDKYVKLDPFTTTRFFFPVEHVISTKDIMSHDEFRATVFFEEWAQPQGWIDFVSASLEKSPTSYAECGVFRHERDGVTDDNARRRMSLVIAHISRAVLIGNAIDSHKVEATALADTLDGIAAAMILVDAGGRVVHANACGLAMLDQGSVLHAPGGKLAAINPRTDHALQDIFANASAGDAAIGVKGIAVPLVARDGERYVAHVLPLTSGARKQAGVAYSAVATVFVRKAALDLPHPIETIASAFRLTPAEMQVLMMIVEVGGVPEVAPVLGVSETTVKTHLQHIFAKTGATRQADLVKLVAGYMSPLSKPGG